MGEKTILSRSHIWRPDSNTVYKYLFSLKGVNGMQAYEKEAIIEGIKNGIRNIWFSIFPVLILGINTTTGEISFNRDVIIAVAVVSILTAIDGVMHEWGKAKDMETLKKGLSFGV